MAETVSVKRRLGEKMLMPVVAAGTSAAVGYVVKRAPGFVEEKVWPRVRDAAQGSGLGEKLPEQARSVVASGGELADQLVERAQDVTGIGGDDSEPAGDSRFSADELARRSEERARHRAERQKTTAARRKTTKSK
jgi:hypothetical protein